MGGTGRSRVRMTRHETLRIRFTAGMPRERMRGNQRQVDVIAPTAESDADRGVQVLTRTMDLFMGLPCLRRFKAVGYHPSGQLILTTTNVMAGTCSRRSKMRLR